MKGKETLKTNKVGVSGAPMSGRLSRKQTQVGKSHAGSRVYLSILWAKPARDVQVNIPYLRCGYIHGAQTLHERELVPGSNSCDTEFRACM